MGADEAAMKTFGALSRLATAAPQGETSSPAAMYGYLLTARAAEVRALVRKAEAAAVAAGHGAAFVVQIVKAGDAGGRRAAVASTIGTDEASSWNASIPGALLTLTEADAGSVLFPVTPAAGPLRNVLHAVSIAEAA
jgi:hypothetical protein